MPSQKYTKVPLTPENSTNMMEPTNERVGEDEASAAGSIVKLDGVSGGGIPSTDSSQQLIGDSESAASLDTDRNNSSLNRIKYSSWFAMIVLCFVNLINYMDRFTIAGE